jgi:hypothetical protein
MRGFFGLWFGHVGDGQRRRRRRHDWVGGWGLGFCESEEKSMSVAAPARDVQKSSEEEGGGTRRHGHTGWITSNWPVGRSLFARLILVKRAKYKFYISF